MHETKEQIKAGPVTGFMIFSDMKSLAEKPRFLLSPFRGDFLK